MVSCEVFFKVKIKYTVHKNKHKNLSELILKVIHRARPVLELLTCVFELQLNSDHVKFKSVLKGWTQSVIFKCIFSMMK